MAWGFETGLAGRVVAVSEGDLPLPRTHRALGRPCGCVDQVWVRSCICVRPRRAQELIVWCRSHGYTPSASPAAWELITVDDDDDDDDSSCSHASGADRGLRLDDCRDNDAGDDTGGRGRVRRSLVASADTAAANSGVQSRDVVVDGNNDCAALVPTLPSAAGSAHGVPHARPPLQVADSDAGVSRAQLARLNDELLARGFDASRVDPLK